ncbi:hypothetical protein BCT56_12595 [Vibrio lentus]|uniref:Uncharacterized protein n=3 Tax=Vibrio lentus TaxID=136468 RepID=A0A2J6U995_9VIBR|nr:hypothetical protein BCU51_02555 [Vibrio lentus]PMK34657.1 hypothetical protein BCU02_19380 [Vibrio lentus]PMK48325.1 hypothetical protein BCT99_15800 [Vibrio lentus]PML34780.1 hypothetical protein BCT79_09410 [Vibrio lentus]PMM33303.1 hypothetical protein BCT56_12595 [Vibrio lentus]
MNFDGYFEKIQIQIEKVDSLEDLLVWRKRINIGHSGLSFRTEQGRLISHCYRRFKDKEYEITDLTFPERYKVFNNKLIINQEYSTIK